jgi:hypothetical protein
VTARAASLVNSSAETRTLFEGTNVCLQNLDTSNADTRHTIAVRVCRLSDTVELSTQPNNSNQPYCKGRIPLLLILCCLTAGLEASTAAASKTCTKHRRATLNPLKAPPPAIFNTPVALNVDLATQKRNIRRETKHNCSADGSSSTAVPSNTRNAAVTPLVHSGTTRADLHVYMSTASLAGYPNRMQAL